MKKLNHLLMAVAWPIAAMTNSVAENPESATVIEGEAAPDFIKKFIVDGNFQIPAVLFFDKAGCLLWSAFGPDIDHASELEKKLAEPDLVCEDSSLASVLQTLEKSGLQIETASVTGRPALIWYSSDSICQSCAEIRQASWPVLAKLVPETTTLLLLELK